MHQPESKAPVSVIIITHNEEAHIEKCVLSVSQWADQVFVVDSFSSDRTVELAKRTGAEVVENSFESPAQQKNWALENLPIKHDWTLFLDADEWVPDELRDEMIQAIADAADDVTAFKMRYRLIFYGKWIRHSGWYPVWITRLVRRSVSRWERRRVDEHIITNGRVARLEHDLIHESLHDMYRWIEKHNRYSEANAQEYALILRREPGDRLPAKAFGSQAERKRFIKERIWPYLPGRALVYFFYLYVFRRGFLDGRRGLIFCVMHAIFEHFNTMKLWELLNYKEQASDRIILASYRSD